MAEVTAQLSLDIAKLKAGLEKAKSEIQAFKEHAKAQKISLGVDQGVGQYGPSQMPLPASVRNLFGGIGANGSAGMFGELASSTGMQAGEGISAGMAAGIGGAAGAAVTAFAAVLKKLLGMAEDAAMDMAKAVYHGLEFNYELNNASVGISNVIGQFQGLNKEASKDAAAAALARIVELEPETAGTLQDLVQGFMATIAASQSAGLSINENITLVSKFANALSNIGMPTWQLPQELRSILSGNITKDSMVAKVLQISNEDVAQWKAAGTLFEELSNKVGKISDAGDSAQVALTSLKSVVDQALGNMTKPLFDELVQSFTNVVFAQLRIAAINAALTALFLLGILPLLGRPLPMAGTLVAVTFFAGLLPVVGNLISNTVIVIIASSNSLLDAGLCLAWLVAIHKLEYFLNAHIIGTRIRAHAWELLIVMLVMEALFGLAGLLSAPIVYAQLKCRLHAQGWLD